METEALIIAGAGITGLSAAWYLRHWNPLVLEASGLPGGNVQSREEAGFLSDLGPNSLLLRGHQVRELLEELGLGPELCEANPVARRRYVLNRHREMVALGPRVLLGSRLLGLRARLKLLGEPFRPRGQSEESISTFVNRRLGPEILQWMVSPFVSGVFAGNPDRLSVSAALPRLAAMEREYGSLVRAALHQRWRGGRTSRSRLVSFRKGMQTLPKRLADTLGDRLLTNTPVESLHQEGDLWKIRSGNRTWHTGKLLLALPAPVLADLLRPVHAGIAETLEEISCPAVATIGLGFARHQVEHSLDGFGVLIPRVLGIQTLGALFSSTLFPDRAPPGHVLLTAFLGGAQNDIRDREEAGMVRQILEDLRPILRIHGDPEYIHARLWSRAIPQYELGHQERLERIDGFLEELPGLSLMGNWRGGVSLGDCIAQAAGLARDPAWQNAGTGKNFRETVLPR